MSVNKNGGTSILNVSGDAEQWTDADGRATAAVRYTDALTYTKALGLYSRWYKKQRGGLL